MKGFRTIFFAALVAGLGLAYDALPTVKALIPPDYYGLILFFVGAVVGILRTVTDSPVFKKELEDELSQFFQGPKHD